MRDCRGALALLALIAGQAGAQTRAFSARVDSLATIAQRAHAAVDAYDDSVRRAARRLDTAYAGIPLVLAERPISGLARRLAPGVIDSLTSALGAASSHLMGYTVVARLSDPPWWRTGSDTAAELVISIIRPGGSRERTWRAVPDSAGLAASMAEATTYAAFSAADSAFFAWAGNAVPTDTVHTSEWARQRLLLVSAPFAVGLRCYRGDLLACRHALHLAPVSDPVLEWNDSTSRRELVRRHGDYARRVDAAAEQRCQHGSDSACIALLRQFPEATFRAAAPLALRGGVLAYAVSVGGRGSLERLLADTSMSTGSRLAASAGVPLDTLLSRWHARIRDTRAPSEDLPPVLTLLALAWATGIGALSLRSSRWR